MRLFHCDELLFFIKGLCGISVAASGGRIILKNQVFSKIFPSLLLSLFLASCASETEGTTPQPLIGEKLYDTGSCETQPESGSEMVNFNNTGPIEDSGYFNKVFLFQPFEKALTSSSLSIAQVLQRQGLQLYQVVENPAATCRYFDFLYEAPSQQLKSWEAVTFSGPSTSALLGLFTTFYSKDTETLNVSITEPTILLRSDTQKWTLIHEMSHYLFARGRINENNMPFNRDLEKQIDETKLKISHLEAQWETALNIIKAFTRLINLVLELDGRGPLEEFTIESMLSKKAQDEKISGINMEIDINNSFNYMAANSSLVLPSYRMLVDQIDSFDFSAFEVAEKKQAKLSQNLQGTIDFILDHLDRVRKARKGHLQPTHTHFESSINHHHFDVESVQNRHNKLKIWLK